MWSYFIFSMNSWVTERGRYYRAPFILIKKLSAFGVEPKRFFLKAFMGAFGKLLSVGQFGIFYKVLNAMIQAKPATFYEGMLGAFLTWVIPARWVNTNCVWMVLILISLSLKTIEIWVSYYSDKYIFEAHKELEMNIQHEVMKKALAIDLLALEQFNAVHHRSWTENVDLIIRSTQSYADTLKVVYQLLMKAVTVAFLCVLMVFLQFKFFLFAILIVFFKRILLKMKRDKINELKKESHSSTEIKVARNRVSSIMGALMLVKFYHQEEKESEAVKIEHQKINQVICEEKKVELIESPVEDFAKVISFIMITVLPPFFLAITKKGISRIAISLLAIQQIQAALDQVHKYFKMINKSLAEVSEIDELLAIDVTKTDNMDLAHNLPFESLSLQNVHFQFQESKWGLKNINFSLHARERVAFVGPAGSGKSTFSKLLMGLYSFQEGAYWVNQVPVKKENARLLTPYFSFVSQEPLWFHESIFDNLCYGLTEKPSLETVEMLCEEIGILSAIQKSSKSWDTVLNYRGGFFSQGQAQMLSLVRAALRHAPILILDEPTSALDAISELRAQKFIENHFSHAAKIIIAHRLSSVVNADRVYYFENGRILESGTIKALLEKKGKFSALWSAYFSVSEQKQAA